MKKYFSAAVIILAGLAFLPSKATAQYNIMSGYNTTNLAIESAAANRRAASMRKGRRSAKKKIARRKALRRTSRRVSSLENSDIPKFNFSVAATKPVDIV